ncbi:MAG: histidine-type phosphatase [Candidatus Cryptobacteroides sp.]
MKSDINMTMLRKTIIAILAFLAAFATATAQTYSDIIRDYRQAAVGVYHPYHTGDLTDSQAPKGFKPFYISHFGRHGSRYRAQPETYTPLYDGYAKIADLLTGDGRIMMEGALQIVEAHKDMYGELTPLGAREHYGIAQRMYNRFLPVFRSRTRNEVECCASTVNRCIISMCNFSQGLDDCNPGLDFAFYTGDRYMAYIMKGNPHKEIKAYVKNHLGPLKRERCGYGKLFATMFTDPDAAAARLKDPYKFALAFYDAAAMAPDLDFLGIDLLQYFDIEELTAFAECDSDDMFAEVANSCEFGDLAMSPADDLLEDFIVKADAALQDNSHRAADLRFGHDSGLLPLACLIGIREMSVKYPSETAHDNWNTYERIPMGSNLQMIFYRNAAGKVLVKLLYNEQETCIPSIEPFSGNYYDWGTLRSWLASRVEFARTNLE